MARFDEQGIPVLDLSDKTAAAVEKTRKAAADGEPEYLLGEVVLLDNPHPAVGPTHPYDGIPPDADVTPFTIGAETLDEALKSIIGSFDTYHSGPYSDPSTYTRPGWVSSSHPALAKALAEHYSSPDHECKVLDLTEVTA